MEDLRALSHADVPACLALSAEANWNQEAADWDLILSAGEARGIARGDKLIASAAIVSYGARFGWICMVLVTASERRKGHASRLMRWGIERLHNLGMVAGLDATPAGREVYRQLGFADIYTLRRMERMHHGSVTRTASALAVRPLGESDFAAIESMDATAFGASREPILRSLLQRRPDLARVAVKDATISGYCMGRSGRTATQIGPVIADDEDTAIALLSEALEALDGAVFMDVSDRHVGLIAWLEANGFRMQRPFTRMLKGRTMPLDDPSRIFAIAGPEFG